LIPRKVTIKSTTNEECFFNDYHFAKFASPRTFCAGERGKTPCQGNFKSGNPEKLENSLITINLNNFSGDSGAGYFVNNDKTFQIAGLVSAALIQECGTNDFVLFTDVAKFADWVKKEISITENTNSFDSVFNSFDDGDVDAQGLNSNLVNAQCTFKDSG